MLKTNVYYCDMDGVLADFNAEPNAVDRFKTEKDFFYNLQPIKENVETIKTLIKKGYNVKILTTSPHIRADIEKLKWLKQELPEIKEKDVIFARPNTPKIEYIHKKERKRAVLFDDYGKNVQEWVEKGGRYAIKVLNDRVPNETTKKIIQYKDLSKLL